MTNYVNGLYTPRSLNNRLIVEIYKKEGLRSEVKNGFALVDQKTSVKGLTILVDTKLTDGTYIEAGSKAWVREEALHTRPWAQKALKSEAINQPFLIVDLTDIEFITPPEPIKNEITFKASGKLNDPGGILGDT